MREAGRSRAGRAAPGFGDGIVEASTTHHNPIELMDTFGYSDADMVDTAPANDAVWPGRASAPPGGSVAKSGCMVKCLRDLQLRRRETVREFRLTPSNRVGDGPRAGSNASDGAASGTPYRPNSSKVAPSRAARDPGHRVMRRIVIVGGRPGSFGAHQGGAPSISPIDIPSACSTIGTTRSAHSSMLRMALALS